MVSASDPDAFRRPRPIAGKAIKDAVSSDGVIANVAYYINGTQVGESTSAPYSFTFAPDRGGQICLERRGDGRKRPVGRSARP